MHRSAILLVSSVLFVVFNTSLKAVDIVFDNSSIALSSGVSVTDLSAIYGDFVQLTKTGKLSEFQFAIFCSASSSGPLTSATSTLSFYDYTGGTIGSLFGSFTANVGAIAQGTYVTITLSQLDNLNINLNSTNILITQQLSSVVGATRMGIPVTYSNATTAGTNLTTGYYRVSGGITNNNLIVTGQTYSNVLYKVGLVSVPEPSSTVLTILGLSFSTAMCQFQRARRKA